MAILATTKILQQEQGEANQAWTKVLKKENIGFVCGYGISDVFTHLF